MQGMARPPALQEQSVLLGRRNWTQARMALLFESDFERISTDLQSFGVSQLRAQPPTIWRTEWISMNPK